MSLTTIAAAVQPDPELAALPASRPERFQRSDFIAAGLVFGVTLGVYIATLAPNVTLEDSGELITAAATLGVGHPPGYPLWTMSGFLLSHLLPFGNMAWRINLLCALFGAASNAVLTLLVCHSGRWLLQRWTDAPAQPVVRRFCFYAGLLAGLTIGFSDVMWSQAVISAVHGTLNALFMNLVLLLFYFWMIEPQKSRRLILAVFVFALGLTNHHTLVQIIPAFLIAAWLVRAGKFWSVFIAVNLFSLSTLVYISWLSGDEQLQTISQVMAKLIFVLTAGVSFFYLKQFRAHLFVLGVATAMAVFAYGFYLMGPDKPEIDHFIKGDNEIKVNTPIPSDLVDTGALRNDKTGWHFWERGTFRQPGWLQGRKADARADTPAQQPDQPPPKRPVEPLSAAGMAALAALALGLLYTSTLDRRLIIGVFVAGWIGLVPYSYEPFAASTHPPINWGYASLRGGFYYEVSREQYPKSLPILIKSTFGKLIGVIDKNRQLDATIDLPNYFPRLGLSFYFYGYSLQSNFTVPLIFLTLAVLLYMRRCDRPQVNWFIFLGAAFFFVGFMLLLIAPQEGFDFQRNLSAQVFHLQSHCIFVILLGYGALAAMTYLHSLMPEIVDRAGVAGFGVPALCLALLPLWSNFDHCSQAGHWFGYDFGADIMRPLDKNAVYLGGSDPGRFVPTYMAFVESQQDDRWKREPGFDRRDVAVITQNALCDTAYNYYIRDQYDPRYRPDPAATNPALIINTPDGPKPGAYTPFEKRLGRDRAYPTEPVICLSDDELKECYAEYYARPEVAARISAAGPEAALRAGTTDVFEMNGIATRKIFEKNRDTHTFYIEQCVPMDWMYPYLLPSGLILKLSPKPVTDADFKANGLIEEDRKFWDAYSQRLLTNPKFHLDDDASLSFGRLAYWHADLYRFRHLDKEEEYWLRLSLALCPQFPDAVSHLTGLLVQQQRFDEAEDVAKQAIAADPFSDEFTDIEERIKAERLFDHREADLRDQLSKSPYDVDLNVALARVLQDEGKFQDVDDRLRIAAGLTNWSHEDMAGIVQYYVDTVHNPEAAIAFLEVRAKIDPKSSELVYNLAALHAVLNHADDAIRYLTQAIQDDPVNSVAAARSDPRFRSLLDNTNFVALLNSVPPPTTNSALVPPATNPAPIGPAGPTAPPKPATNPPAATVPKPVKN